ncbi:MAG: ABC transporter permease, partial [Alphaproteobacteria bacterium]|nr:ABC transporter permease [Alphaproteobacteria bacterium]
FTLGMVVAVVILTVPLGVILGCIAGYAGGALDAILMRLTDVFLAFPRLVLALALVAALKPGVESAVIAIALTAWPSYARLARAESLRLREADFIVALRLAGASRWRIVLHHILPLAVPSAIVRTSLDMSSIVLTAAGLGFLGLGAQPPLPEWGTMISTGRSYLLEQWWVPAAPGLAILLVSLAFNLLGDGLRDALDPKQR